MTRHVNTMLAVALLLAVLAMLEQFLWHTPRGSYGFLWILVAMVLVGAVYRHRQYTRAANKK